MLEPPLKPHDLGGLHGEHVDRTEKDPALWEKRVDALYMLLQQPSRSLISTDEVRRCVEGLSPEAYTKMSYYERWVFALATILLEKGVITSEELAKGIKTVMEKGDRLP